MDQGKALSALTFALRDLYEIYVVDGQWQAWHDDAPDQDKLTGTTPDELNRAIRADWMKRQRAVTPVTDEEFEELLVSFGLDAIHLEMRDANVLRSSCRTWPGGRLESRTTWSGSRNGAPPSAST